MSILSGALLAAYRARADDGGAYIIIAIAGICLVTAIVVAMLRWALRINEMVKYQRESVEHLHALRKHFEKQEDALNG